MFYLDIIMSKNIIYILYTYIIKRIKRVNFGDVNYFKLNFKTTFLRICR